MVGLPEMEAKDAAQAAERPEDRKRLHGEVTGGEWYDFSEEVLKHKGPGLEIVREG